MRSFRTNVFHLAYNYKKKGFEWSKCLKMAWNVYRAAKVGGLTPEAWKAAHKSELAINLKKRASDTLKKLEQIRKVNYNGYF